MIWRSIPLKSKAFLAISFSGLITLLVALSIFLFSLQRNIEEEIATQALNIASLTAARIDVRHAYSAEDPAKELKRVADQVIRKTKCAFVVFMDMNSIRYTHPNKDLIGKRFTGGDEGAALKGETYSSKAVGISGPSIRAFAPVYDFNERQVGVVAVGFWQPEISSYMAKVYQIFYKVIPISIAIVISFSWIFARNIKNIMFGMEPIEIATLLKERETMLQSVKEGIIAIDQNYKITVINQAAKNLFPPDIEFIGKPVQEVIPTTRLPETMQTGQAEYDNLQIINNNPIITNRIPLKIGKNIVGAIATFRPLTEVNRIAEELTGVKKIVSALRARTHEFQNKLHVISGLIQLGSYEEARQYITSISNKEQSFLNFLSEHINNTTISALLVGKASEAEEKQIKFIINQDSDLYYLPDFLDENAMVVILGNLIDNAFDAVAGLLPERRRVEIKIQQDNKNIIIQVKDWGKGIEAAIRDKIFLEGFSTKGKPGRGLGLVNVKKRVETYRGNIEIQSNENGTIFTVFIPCMQEW
ncbi:MAG: two-component system, CitB family, sensor histidine kinase MalK [Clostridia bacterium]|nr:two-component system, CitB family, sensor histidine kinase MalK [Clostridia bacterium]